MCVVGGMLGGLPHSMEEMTGMTKREEKGEGQVWVGGEELVFRIISTCLTSKLVMLHGVGIQEEGQV